MRLLGWLGCALGVLWVCWGGLWVLWAGLVLAWCWLWCGWGLFRSSVHTFPRVLAWLRCALVLAWCWLGLCGGNCYHRRCLAACRRRVGGLWSQNPPRGCSVARLRPRVVAWVCCGVWWYVSGVVVAWVVFVGGLGGIATIGAALRRVVGVSGVYGRKTPRVLGWKGQRRVPVEGSMVVNLPCGCSKLQFPSVECG